ncbi:MAG: hypothetical protein BWY74_02112 [Firmicutes bacterium ADurb.Bin419]|nr:MAG: hypothetical protein BWY74_02112 [Firmicutes bacterium ADurb.Bin419]
MFINGNELEEAYLLTETARMKLWATINDATLEPFKKDEQGTMQMTETEVNDSYIKITINDILPRAVGVPKSSLEQHWLSLMYKALKDIKIQYQKVLCVIKIFSPANHWDVDNRTYRIIIDSLRYGKIIPNGKCNSVSFMVMGNIDKDNPRTEIYLLEHPDDPFFFVAPITNIKG